MDDDGDDDEIYAVMWPKIYKQIKCEILILKRDCFFILYSLNFSHPWAALVVGVFGAELDGDDDCDDDVFAMPNIIKTKVSKTIQIKMKENSGSYSIHVPSSRGPVIFCENDWQLRLGVTLPGDGKFARCCISADARFVLMRRNNDVLRFLSLSLRCFFWRLTLFLANLL